MLYVSRLSEEGVFYLIYLDNSATTRLDPEVIAVMTDVMQRVFANPASLHRLGSQAERLLGAAREVIARELAVAPGEILFTSGGTESNNLALKGVATAFAQRGRHLITTQIEHPSVFDVCQQLEQRGWQVTYLPVDAEGRVRVDDVAQALRDETVLVSVMQVNNETGTIQPIAEIGQLLAAYPKILFHVDAVQSFGKLPIAPRQFKCDLLSLSAHKLHGPKGVGALYVREGVQLDPLLVGGGQEVGLRSGTHNVPGIAGFAKAVSLVAKRRQQHVVKLQQWKQQFVRRIREMLPQVLVNGGQTAETSSPFVISLSFPDLKSEVIVHALEAEGCYVSSKSACSSKSEKPSRVLLAMGHTPQQALGTIRLSLGYDTNEDELQRAAELLQQVIPPLQKLAKV
jgi:cysteine desulfurase